MWKTRKIASFSFFWNQDWKKKAIWNFISKLSSRQPVLNLIRINFYTNMPNFFFKRIYILFYLMMIFVVFRKINDLTQIFSKNWKKKSVRFTKIPGKWNLSGKMKIFRWLTILKSIWKLIPAKSNTGMRFSRLPWLSN